MIDAETLRTLRGQLVKFARLQLRNDAWADDVVQETLVALVEAPERFAGRSSLKTYSIGILKHKIIDALRAGGREVSFSALEGDADGEGNAREDLLSFESLFDETGHWRDAPRRATGTSPTPSFSASSSSRYSNSASRSSRRRLRVFS
jgi:RNA polymerase sigma-70 factor (ECF subfamily)